MDTEYLKATVGSALSTGIAETVLMRPEDPVDYLAQRLMKWVMDSEAKKAELEGVKAAETEAVKKADAAAVAQREVDKKAKDKSTQAEKEDTKLADSFRTAIDAGGYKAYKYVPYGPVREVMPYLIRRAQENSDALSGALQQRAMLLREVRRRVVGWRVRQLGQRHELEARSALAVARAQRKLHALVRCFHDPLEPICGGIDLGES